MTEPLVAVIVVNYNGGDVTLECLDSIAGLDWPADRLQTILVDNASTDGVADAVEAERPAVRVVRTGANLGFAGGCNAGFAAAPDADCFALVNPDATVDPQWLRASWSTLGSAPRIGGVASKVLLRGAFTEVTMVASAGVRVSGARTDGADRWRDAQFVDGFGGPEHGSEAEPTYRQSRGDGRMRVPAGTTASLRLAADADTAVVLTSGEHRQSVVVGREPAWHDVALSDDRVEVINSAGVVLVDDGYGADRGYLEADGPEFDTSTEVFAWSGAAVLLSGEYVRSLGGFADDFFMYYEDLDLSWRGRLAGWSHRYEPGARVRHRHGASSVLGSPLFDHYVERNRLLTVARNAPASLALRAVVRFLLITASYARRDVLIPVLRGRRPRGTRVRRRLGSFAAFTRRLPAAVAQRAHVRGTVDRRAVLRDIGR